MRREVSLSFDLLADTEEMMERAAISNYQYLTERVLEGTVQFWGANPIQPYISKDYLRLLLSLSANCASALGRAQTLAPLVRAIYKIYAKNKKPITQKLIGFFSNPKTHLSSKILFPQIRCPYLRIMQQLRSRAFQDNPPRLHHISPISQL